MAQRLAAVLLLTGAQHVAALSFPDGGQMILTPGVGTALSYGGGSLDPVSGIPIQSISIDDLFISYDNAGNGKCCPRGTMYNGRTCVFPSTAVCPRGFHLSGNVCVGTAVCPGDLAYVDGMCVDPNEPKCDHEGATFCKETHQCQSTSPPACSPPFERSGSNCVDPSGPQCKTGSYLDRELNLCISNTSPLCSSPDLHLDDKGRCVKDASCPKGTRMKSPGVCESTGLPQCPDSRYRYENGDCILEENPSCPQGGKFVDRVCILEEPPLCERGVYENGSCVSTDGPICPTSQHELKDGVCHLSTPPFCLAGDELFYVEGTQRRAVCCPTRSRPSPCGTKCVSDATEEEQCEDPMHWDPYGNVCWYTPGPSDCPPGYNYHPQHGQCIKTTSPECTTGSLFGGKCHLDDTPKCQEGRYDPPTQKCIAPPPTCPEGSFISGDKCVAIDGRPVCPLHTMLIGTRCVSTSPPECPPKTTLEGGVCVGKDHKPYCPKPNRIEGNKCVVPGTPACPEHTKLVGNDCVSDGDPICVPPFRFVAGSGKCVLPDGPTCGPRFQYSPTAGRCVSPVPPVCPPNSNYVYSQGKCISHNNPTCQEGKLDGYGNCVHDTDPQCPGEDTMFLEGVCVSRFDPECPEYTRLDPATKLCVSQAPPTCPENTELKDGICVAIQQPSCPHDMQLLNNQCVYKGNPDCPTGFRFVETLNKCVLNGLPDCPGNAQYDPVTMQCTTGSAQTCFNLQTCPPVEDDSPPGIGETPIYY